MNKKLESTGFCRVLVAIETDATRFYGANAARPALLGVSDSEQMLAHIAADLKSLFPEISNCCLIAAGALFDQTQVLRPKYPVFGALEAVSTNGGAENFKPGLVSIGATNGKMPSAALQPLPEIPLGLMQLLPVVIQGPSEMVSGLAKAMEYRFIEEGQLSAHSAAWLESAFGISLRHARMMTLTDLNAMLHMQLKHFGFLPLWELLDAGLSGSIRPVHVRTEGGQEFTWENGSVHTRFETFDVWAAHGKGARIVPERQALAAGYGDWTREVRQYLTTLRAHGLDVRFHLAPGDAPLEGTFLKEVSESAPATGDSTITEHSFGELGTIAVTVRTGDIVENYYPLSSRGLNDIQTHLRNHVPGVHSVAFPGTILHSEKTRKLIPDTQNVKVRH